jgi:hypothetical protein
MRLRPEAAYRGLRWPWPAALALVAAACGDPRTMLVVEVHSNLAIPAELDKVELQIKSTTGALRKIPLALGDAAYKLPLRVGLLPGASTREEIELSAVGWKGDRPVVKEEAIVSFVPGASLVLRLYLARECTSDPCQAPSQTCSQLGLCRPKRRQADELAKFEPATTPMPPRIVGMPPQSFELPDASERRPDSAAPPGPDARADLALPSPPDAPPLLPARPDAAAGPEAAPPPPVDAVPPPLLTTGLVGLWRFDELGGARAWDWSGNGNHGTLVGYVGGGTVPSPRGAALALDGVRQWVSVPPSASIDGLGRAMTFAIWTRPATRDAAQATVLSRQRASSDTVHYLLAYVLAQPAASLKSYEGVQAEQRCAGPVDTWRLGDWVHLALTYDAAAGRARLFVNGNPICSFPRSGPLLPDTTPLLFGGRVGGANARAAELFAGLLDEAALWSRELLAEEIRAVVATGVPTPAGGGGPPPPPDAAAPDASLPDLRPEAAPLEDARPSIDLLAADSAGDASVAPDAMWADASPDGADDAPALEPDASQDAAGPAPDTFSTADVPEGGTAVEAGLPVDAPAEEAGQPDAPAPSLDGPDAALDGPVPDLALDAEPVDATSSLTEAGEVEAMP